MDDGYLVIVDRYVYSNIAFQCAKLSNREEQEKLRDWILEFEFGTNWSNYSWFVGDIFGAPLAIEGIMAFFLESA